MIRVRPRSDASRGNRYAQSTTLVRAFVSSRRVVNQKASMVVDNLRSPEITPGPGRLCRKTWPVIRQFTRSREWSMGKCGAHVPVVVVAQ